MLLFISSCKTIISLHASDTCKLENAPRTFLQDLKEILKTWFLCVLNIQIYSIYTLAVSICVTFYATQPLCKCDEREMFSFMSSFMIASWIWQKREKYGVYFSYWGLYSLKYREFSYRYYTWLKWWLVNITIAKKHFFKIFSKF